MPAMTRRRVLAPTAAAPLDALLAVRTDFSPAASQSKKRSLAGAHLSDLTDASAIRAWHDHLLFMVAYPDDAELLRLVAIRLRELAGAVKLARRRGRGTLMRRLTDSGIAYSDTCTSFTLPMCRHLLNRYGAAIDIDWQDGSAGEMLDESLAELSCSVERDGLLSPDLSTQEWFNLSQGSDRRSALGWLIDRFEGLPGTDFLRDQAFDRLELPLRWRHGGGTDSRTFNRFSPRRPFYQREPLVRLVDTHAAVLAPMPRARRLPVAGARRLLDVCRAALCVRRRETDPLTYASERDVALLRMDRGIDVAIFGMLPSRRLPIESYFGFVAARNRVPVAYGGAWVLGDRAEIGVNIFDEFRGGESAVVFAQIMRAYHHDLGPRRFYVDPFQFGQDNPEAIRSGAFWFYWRLGFRPTQPVARKLAAEEAAHIAADRTYRSPPGVLRRLAKSPILFDLDRPGADTPHLEDVDLRALGLAVTRWIGEKFDGDRSAAQKWCLARALRLLTPPGFARRPSAERQAFESLSVLLGPIHELEKWPKRDYRALAELMFAKGGPSERDYSTRHRRLTRLQDSLRHLSLS